MEWRPFIGMLIWCLVLLPLSCGPAGEQSGSSGSFDPPDPPRGYVQVLEIEQSGRILRFGPFVGYYFKPADPSNLTRLKFICFNERRFYTLDLPQGATLFEGEAVLARLPDTGRNLPDTGRTSPVFFGEAPEAWLDSRPEPKDEFVHFHSCYDGAGAVRTGFWLRHRATAAFTYDMGGKVGPDSPLFHRAEPGLDKNFAKIIEFDRGPDA